MKWISGCQELDGGGKYEHRSIIGRVFWDYGTDLYTGFHGGYTCTKICRTIHQKIITYPLLV